MEMFMLVDSTPLSALIWLLLGITALYLARNSAHKAIRSSAVLLHNVLRLAARALDVTC